MQLPPKLVFHVPHDSTVIPREVREQFVLDDDALARELLRMTDHKTLDLFVGKDSGAALVAATVSRLVVDVERFEDDAQESMAAKGMGVVYASTSSGSPLRRTLSATERESLLARYYRPHHERLRQAVQRALEARGACLIVDCHSFPSVPLPYEPSPERPELCIGTDDFHTPASVQAAFVEAFQEAGFAVALNVPFAGTIVPMQHYRQDARVMSIMVEVNRGLYLDERSGELLPTFNDTSERIRHACSRAGVQA